MNQASWDEVFKNHPQLTKASVDALGKRFIARGVLCLVITLLMLAGVAWWLFGLLAVGNIGIAIFMANASDHVPDAPRPPSGPTPLT